ncbi:MAG: Gfo/Idh/MocA family oxidoreductase [Gemmatimonadetes bacterium]|nr:Gfo/Idh/MocA family oxidoreductase [Gemmatimonadota bacterium]MDE3259920.1 Gfo/Idh/MocA family oxidoreductase [Gemmatimonadota bacterium]
MAAEYRIAVVGTGYIGLEHIKAIASDPRAKLRSICGSSRSAQRLDEMKAEFGAERVTADYGEVVADDVVDVVYLCTPNRLHADQAVAALEAGKHVFCEKPMANTLQGCRRMVAAVEDSGRQLMVGHGARFRQLHRAVKDLFDSGKLGEACFCESDYVHSLGPFLAGTGHQWWRHRDESQFAVIGGACHPLDLMRWIVGELEDVSAYGVTKVLHDVDWHDTVIASLKFRNGAVGKCLVSVGAPRPYSMTFNLYGTEGTVEENRLYLREFGEIEEFAEIPFPVLGEVHACAEELSHFLHCLDTGESPMIDVKDGARTMAACFAVAESIETGTPVSVVTEF